jgi:hypothetical protein
MRPWIALAFAAYLLPAQAETPPIACDTYGVAFCFPKGRDTVVTQRWSEGQELYEVTSRETLLMSIRTGAPERRHAGRISLKHYQEDGFDIDIGLIEAAPGDKVVDILVGYPDGQALHVSVAGAEGRKMLADVMSNFRPCRRHWFAGIECEDTPLFTPADAELIRNIP